MLARQKKNYNALFQEAFERYSSQSERPGYESTLFTWFRHSAAMYPALKQFQDELSSCETDVDQERVIQSWLKNPLLKAHHHSFRSYLVDVLSEADTNKWSRYDNKPVVFYNHTRVDNPYLYRGSLQFPDNAFKEGMHSLSYSKNIEEYATPVTGSVGISTCLSAKIANGYTCSLRMNHHGVNEFSGFLYQIHYRGNKAVDIDATQKARHSKLSVSIKDQVNIVDCIPKEDVVGYGFFENDRYVELKRNQNYNPDRAYDEPKEKSQLLRSAFSR